MKTWQSCLLFTRWQRRICCLKYDTVTTLWHTMMETFRCHFTPFTIQFLFHDGFILFRTGLMWMQGLIVVLLFRFQVVLTSCRKSFKVDLRLWEKEQPWKYGHIPSTPWKNWSAGRCKVLRSNDAYREMCSLHQNLKNWWVKSSLNTGFVRVGDFSASLLLFNT